MIPSLMRISGRTILISLLCVTSALLAVGMVMSVLPAVQNVTLVPANGRPERAELPLRRGPELAGAYTVRVSLWLPVFHPTQFAVTPDDCLESLTINGQSMPLDTPVCDYAQGRVLDLGPFLHAGGNSLEFSMVNNGGPTSLRMHASAKDPAVMSVLVALLLLCGASVLLLGRFIRMTNATMVILFLGMALRLVYTWNTPYDVRGYDFDGHHEYTQYILTHWQVPNPQDGWQFYQPPLGYTLYALAIKACTPLLSSISPQVIEQAVSLLLSFVILTLALAVLRTVFTRKADQPWFHLASLLVAVFPGLVMLSARVNNDVLFLTIAMAWLLTLVRFNAQPRWSTWICLSALLGLGLITKSTMAIPLAATFLWLPLARHVRWRGRITMGLACMGIVLLIAGWFVIPHALQAQDPDRAVVGNIRNLNGALRLDDDPVHLLTFQPAQILHIPYANPWDDTLRRRFFLEYWYKSAFFGEFDHGDKRRLLAQIILLLSMMVLPLFPTGFIVDIHENRLRTSLPLLITGTVQLAAHVTLRLMAPFSSIQDFRYSLLLVLPVAYFTARGACALPRRIRAVGRDALIISAFLWAAFSVSLIVL